MITVKFTNVGRGKKTWTAIKEKGELTYNWLYKQIKEQQALMSSDIDFLDDGTILAGFRDVGKYQIINL